MEQVTGAVTKALKIVVREGLTVIALASYLLYLNWRLCLVFVAVIPVIAVVVSIVGKHFRRYSRRIQSSMGDVTQVSGESVSGYREIRIFGGQPQQQERFRKASQYNRAQNLKLAFADGLSTPVIQTLLALALAHPGVVRAEPGDPARVYRRFAGGLPDRRHPVGQTDPPVE